MTAERILIVGPSWVGDMVMAQVLVSSLVRTREDVVIDMLAPPASLTVAERMPEVRNAIRFDLAHGELNLGKRIAYAQELKDQYDEVIVTPNSLKSALVPFFAGIPTRTGFLGEMRYFLLNDLRLLNKRTMPRMIDRFMALGDEPDAEAPLPSLAIDEVRQAELIDELGLSTSQPIIGLCPGAEFGEAKRWPAEHFAAVAEFAVSRGMCVWLFGGPGDVAVAEEILEIADSDSVVNLAGKTSLTDAIDLIALTSAVVTNDSGLMHVAAATGRQTLVVYGSTSPGFTPPLTPDAVIYSLDLPCAPCFKRVCPLGHTNCLKDLEPVRLFEAVEQAAS